VRSRRTVRAVVVLAGALLTTGLGGGLLPAPAAAHSPGGDADRYTTAVTSVSPAFEGVTVTVSPDGAAIRVSNTTGVPLVVLGYAGEPYLRVGPAGVEENVASVTSYVNGPYGSGLVTGAPPADDAPRPEQWVSRGLVPTATWHDVRLHHAGSGRPAAVVDEPRTPRVLATWTVRARYRDAPVTVTGTLSWAGTPGFFDRTVSRVLWGVAAAAAIGVVVLVARGRRRAGPGPQPDDSPVRSGRTRPPAT
jgi:hypothetical protein